MIEISIPILTESDVCSEVPEAQKREGFHTIAFKEGGVSRIPDDFFSCWRNRCNTPGKFHIGRCSGLGAGSFIRFSQPEESVTIGRYVSAGIETIFMCSGYHETRGISTCEFGSYDKEMIHVRQRNHGDIVVKNDVWFGDECMIMADSIVENGCIIGARSLLPLHFRSEPFGIYVGSPARLKKFRFSQPVINLLLDIAWWDMPFKWIKQNNQFFCRDMTASNAVETLQELKKRKEEWMNAQNISAA